MLYSSNKECSSRNSPDLKSPTKTNFINRLSTSISKLLLRKLFISAQPTCNHEDRSCYDYSSSPPLWSYTVIAFVQPYKSRPQKTTVTKHVFITSDASDNDSYCWLSVGTERYLLTFRKIKAPSVNCVACLKGKNQVSYFVGVVNFTS